MTMTLTLTQVYPRFAILFAVLNASHGMEFWHTALLAGLVLCDYISQSCSQNVHRKQLV